MKVITTNIRFENDQDTHPWAERKLILSDIIADFSPCFFGTQEGRQPQLIQFQKINPQYRLIDNHRDWIDERMYPCLFFNINKVAVNDSGDFWLSETPDVPASKSFDSAFPRLCTWANITHHQKGTILIANVHLDHVKTETRQEQVKVLINELNKINTDQSPIILMGDFNEGPTGEVRKILNHLNSDLEDGWLTLNQKEETSYHKFQGVYPEGERIDWILHSSPFEIKEILLDKRIVNQIYPSDHYPVLAQYK